MARMSDIRKKSRSAPVPGTNVIPVDSAMSATMPEPDQQPLTPNSAAIQEAAKPATSIEPVAEEKQQWVVFQCADVHYALRSDQIALIEMYGDITPVPNTFPSVVGVFNLRGEIIPVIDLRARLGLPVKIYTLSTRIIVVQIARRRIGMIVDSAREVLHLLNSQIHPAPDMMYGLSGKYLHGIVVQPERTILILDLDSVLQVECSIAAIESPPSTQHESKLP